MNKYEFKMYMCTVNRTDHPWESYENFFFCIHAQSMPIKIRPSIVILLITCDRIKKRLFDL